MNSSKNRPSLDEYFMSVARVVATRSTCIRRAVGCVLVDGRHHVIATGYNGVPTGWAHCNQYDEFHETGYPHACPGAFKPSGSSLGECHAIHAEQNALLQCGDVYSINTAYCTTSPCVHCVKLLLNTACRRIVYDDEYTHTDARELWERDGREWVHLPTSS